MLDSSRLYRISSCENVSRAYWELLDFPTKTVILADQVHRKEYYALEEQYVRQLSRLKLEFDPTQNDPDWGRIIVKAVKTRVHCIPTELICDIAMTISQLQNDFIVRTGAELRVDDRLNPNQSRASDSCIILRTESGLRFIAVLESAYCESAKMTEQEFEKGLSWYFENDNDINLVIGVYMVYTPPSMELPDCIPMTLIALHRNNSIDPQRIPFGQDANHNQPIELTVDCPTLFGLEEIPTGFPQSFTIDIRYLLSDILSQINYLREMSQICKKDSEDGDGLKTPKKEKKPPKKRRKGQS
jgi:hypothetical protein